MWRGPRWRWALALVAGAALVWALRGGAGGGAGAGAGAGRARARAPDQWVEGRELPLIFIGGVPRSGTTLMRAMLDAHPDVRCGQETRVVPRILQMRQHWAHSAKESVRLEAAGVSKAVLDNAIAAFCLEVIAGHGEPAPRLCNKDPLVLKMGSYVLELFPNAKFLFMMRDGRATVHSIISRKVTITGFDLTSYRQCLSKWNHAVGLMYQQCKSLGAARCLPVRYEALVLRPRETLRAVLAFLELPWTDAVLHHERYINQPNGVALSDYEWSVTYAAEGLGAARCLPVRYEALVLRPRETLRAVLAFLELPWTDAVLHHERYINQPNGVALSDVERSSDQVVRPVNLDALDKWVAAMPADVRADMAELAPMLSVLGYDPWANPPKYAEPEPGRAPPAPVAPVAASSVAPQPP